MPINCPRLGCPGIVPDGIGQCPDCDLKITPDDRKLAERLSASLAPPGSMAWWLGGDGLKFVFQVVGVLFLATALVVIVVLFFQSSNDKVELSKFTTTQGLIAGVLLAAIAAAVIVAIMTVLFSSGNETLKDRAQLVRDLLAPILAIFGTITGFYFGAKTVEDQQKPDTEQRDSSVPGSPSTKGAKDQQKPDTEQRDSSVPGSPSTKGAKDQQKPDTELIAPDDAKK